MKSTYFMLLLALLTSTAHAQEVTPLTQSIELTAIIQNPASINNGTTTTVPAASKSTITDASFLATLAQDEFHEGNYGSSSFPRGSKLVWIIPHPLAFSNNYYVVEDAAGQVLVNVSDLMQLQLTGDLIVDSFGMNNTTGVFVTPWINNYVATLSFDDTGAGGTMTFTIQGLVQATTTDKTSKDGDYTETVKGKWINATGFGTINGNAAVFYGGSTSSSEVTYTIP